MSDQADDSEKFSLPGEIPDATSEVRNTPGIPTQDWLSRGLRHPAGRGWDIEPVRQGPSPLHHASHGRPPRVGEDWASAPVSDAALNARLAEYGVALRPPPGKPGQWPAGWLPGDAPAELDLGMGDDPFAASRVFDAPARVRFLDTLAASGEVRLSAARVGVSRETCYRARRRWPDFARLWDAALVHARARGEAELAHFALDGVPVPVIVRGEHVGTWRRIDARLLLAHLARLDRHAEAHPEAAAAAERFDELLARHAGHPEPDGFDEAQGLWDESRFGGDERAALAGPPPPTRKEWVTWYRDRVLAGVKRTDEERVWLEATAEAEALYDGWLEGARARVDAIVDGGNPPPPARPEPVEGGEGDQPPAGGDLPTEYKSLELGLARAKVTPAPDPATCVNTPRRGGRGALVAACARLVERGGNRRGAGHWDGQEAAPRTSLPLEPASPRLFHSARRRGSGRRGRACRR